ncbi:type I-E CRISPR-associated protein Cas6/Cse3/CasE [Nocardia sp. NPDC004654]|uniref:type I-E CRISPR-associated protein Cas6/Cse3/CasE n=1 Tax=Nocardia sp. NPDC004654 TaxID=3154776 RepID=UPI0033A1BE76
MTLWLTRIQLNLRDTAVRRDLRNAIELHRTLMTLMPDGLGDTARQQTGLLYRIDETPTTTQLLIQSQHAPDLTKLPTSYGQAATRTLDQLLDNLTTGAYVRYRIIGNPTKRNPRGHSEPGKIRVLRGPDADQWWVQRAHNSGLTINTLTATHLDDVRGTKNKATAPIRHAATRFDGTATITQPDQLRHAITTGIGRGKSYGCGLLSLAANH